MTEAINAAAERLEKLILTALMDAEGLRVFTPSDLRPRLDIYAKVAADAALSAAPASVGVEADVERVARIIDPHAFDVRMGEMPTGRADQRAHYREAALTKARAILGSEGEKGASQGAQLTHASSEAATEATCDLDGAKNVELYADFPEPLRGDLCYLHAALSYYDGTPAVADVGLAWLHVTQHLSAALSPAPTPPDSQSEGRS